MVKFDPVWLPPSRLSSSPLLSSSCLSFCFYLSKTPSVESARLYFSHRLSSMGVVVVVVGGGVVHFPSSFPHVSTSPAVTRFFDFLLTISNTYRVTWSDLERSGYCFLRQPCLWKDCLQSCSFALQLIVQLYLVDWNSQPSLSAIWDSVLSGSV